MLKSVSSEIEWGIVLDAKRKNNISIAVNKSKEAYYLKTEQSGRVSLFNHSLENNELKIYSVLEILQAPEKQQ